MEQINISEFTANCLTVLARVEQTGKSVLVTRFGRPEAQVTPLPTASPETWLSSMGGQDSIVRDLIEPVVDPAEWEVRQSSPGTTSK